MESETEKLSITYRLSRLKTAVEALPDGDQDKADLILLFTVLDEITEEKHQLQGAVNLAKYALEMALEKISKQKIALDLLMVGKTDEAAE